jgi:hypothetical protein
MKNVYWVDVLWRRTALSESLPVRAERDSPMITPHHIKIVLLGTSIANDTSVDRMERHAGIR